MVESVGDIAAALDEIKQEEAEQVPPQPLLEQPEEVSSRHRKERKDLQAQIQALKKNAPKSDKKKRKEVMEGVARLESDMEQRHAAELKASQQQQEQLENSDANNTSEVGREEDDDANDSAGAAALPQNLSQDNGPQQRVSKAQKRRDKKAQEARARQEEILAAVDDPNAPKAVEARQLEAKLKERSLALHQIRSDGDCLYNAVRHQLQLSGRGDYSLEQLRERTADYLRANKDALICYMTDQVTGEYPNDADYEAYCEAVRSTPAWGGQVELNALSSFLQVPIEVLQADGSSVVQGADQFDGPNLLIVYHRHLYSLGEHYNSTQAAKDNDGREDSF